MVFENMTSIFRNHVPKLNFELGKISFFFFLKLCILYLRSHAQKHDF